MTKQYDIIIVGGGIVGISLALLFRKSALKIAILEAASPHQAEVKPQQDRTLVIAHSSQVILKMLGIWQKIEKEATPINKIHVSDRGNFGTTQIIAEQEGVPHLGYVLSASTLACALQVALLEQPAIDLIQPARFSSLDYYPDHVSLTANMEHEAIKLSSTLLVAADGQHSAVRQFLQIKNITHDYRQVAILCHVSLKRPHQGIAYERFTDQGPLAMLPLNAQRAAVVWTVNKNTAEWLLSLSNSDFLSQLQTSFGYRLGKIVNTTVPFAVNLQLVTASQQCFPRTLLLGNAAHTLHPVAGQGLNLALRDVAMLSEIIQDRVNNNTDIGDPRVLQCYLEKRKSDQEHIIHLTHSLVGIFSNSLLPLVMLRGVGMMMLDRVMWLKKLLTKRMLGLGGQVPRLACGLTLDTASSAEVVEMT